MNDQASSDGTDQPAVVPAAWSGSLEESRRARREVDEEFSAFYRRTVRPLVGFLINQGASPAVAADIAQDTMTKAYQRWSELRDPRAWAHTVASRALIRTFVSVDEGLVDSVPEPTSLLARPDAIAEWEARYDARPMLASLPPRQRQVLAWTLAGYTPGDIADLLGLPAETVRGNLAKARRAAVAYLAAKEGQR
ncbi:RNA polymerase sigma factor [Streptomyces hesseae]|uniref:Sigma-70 family RNA polymerase sigma factor n=1 Tax=Streptomyces hesseae TaxID=3075519 RepID=A0ABU2SP33_9ACTN|nr:sigma-70 family RNA polymerase sigma factor [Streptomyces sp. DSM 40473]MDT0450747.1 sigma-70 family RNA polymerase sigma factor [Streptomyces sp. DSM 40473]